MPEFCFANRSRSIKFPPFVISGTPGEITQNLLHKKTFAKSLGRGHGPPGPPGYATAIRQRIQFKLLLLVYRCTHQLAPDYLTDLVVPYVPARSLRSADQNLLTVKRYNLERYGRRSFSVAGPSLWNALPCGIRNSVSLPAFMSSLKTHLFREAFVTLM